jgi:putative ABC transport system permease protein
MQSMASGGVVPWLQGSLQDAQYAWRSFWKSPGYASAAVVTLALAIGANSAIFGAVHAVLLTPLPIREPD